jgi:hypothetical protein
LLCLDNNIAIMSVTTTANPVAQSVLRVLADYELTHSGDNESTDGEVKPPNHRSQEAETTANPDSWPTEYNGIPPHRPINYNLDHELRPWGSNGVETVFVVIMLNGVGLVAAAARSWRLTGGRLTDKIFRFSIGGER